MYLRLRAWTGAVDPLAVVKDRRGTVLLFITNDCPISNGYAPEIHRLCEAYMKQGIAFYLVYSDPSVGAVEAKKHYAEYGYNCMALLDPKHEVGAAGGGDDHARGGGVCSGR